MRSLASATSCSSICCRKSVLPARQEATQTSTLSPHKSRPETKADQERPTARTNDCSVLESLEPSTYLTFLAHFSPPHGAGPFTLRSFASHQL
jgi:hypothetical protein